MHQRAFKEESKVVNRVWVDHIAWNLLQYINVITNLFVWRNYFTELRSKIISYNNFP